MEDTNKKIIQDLVGEFKSLITPKLILSFDALEAAVYKLVQTTNSETLQNRYLDQLESMNLQKEHLIDVFLATVELANNRFIDGNYNYVNVDEKRKQPTLSLSLVEDNSLDEYLARDNLISKCEINCNTNLYGLEQRYAKLASVASLKTTEVPISPIVIVDAFRQSIDAIKTKVDVDMPFRLMLYKLLDQNVLTHLNEVYNDINSYLASKGVIEHISFGFNSNTNEEDDFVIPEQNQSLDEKVETIDPNEKLSLTDIEQEQDAEELNPLIHENIDNSYQLIANILNNKPNDKPATSYDTSVENNQISEQSVNVASDLLEKFNQQAEVLSKITHNISDDQTSKQPVDINVLLKTLNSFQNIDFSKINLLEKNKSPEEVKNDFISQLSNDNNDTIENKDMQAIDLIVLLFKYIVDDRNLPDTIQVILSHLQIPYLKIALQDDRLFADKAHPARQLLNNLSIASVGWSTEVDKDDSFIDKIKSISQRIANNETYSDEYFNELIQEFTKFNKKLLESTQEIENQTNDKLQKKEKLVQAKKMAAEVLINKMTNKKMPKLFKDILLGSWLYILVLTDLKSSRMSDEYKDKVDFINKLIGLAHFSEEVSITKSQINDLLKQYVKGLRLVTFNIEIVKKKLFKLRKQLVNIHFNLDLESTDNETETQETISLAEIQNHEFGVVSYIKEEEALSAANESIVVDEESLNIVKSLQVDDWLTFDDPDARSKSIEAKLSWISPITGKYLFVLASGVKYRDITPQNIAIGLTDKTIEILDNEPLFDRAMESIANTLQARA